VGRIVGEEEKDAADIGVTSPSFRYPGIPEGVSEHLGKALAKETEFPLLTGAAFPPRQLILVH
jgi:hypothetical protein